jgi:hypothetical protein
MVFWTDLLLLTLAQVSKEIDHPVAAYGHQLIRQFLREIQTQNDIEKAESLS